MTSSQSSQTFIRALKASSDPPNPGGPRKIDIARQAWDDNSFYLPSKAEVIVEWILSTLLKEKSQLTPISSVFNIQYWELLLDILSTKTPSNVRPLKTWISPLLHRIPIQPILSSILEACYEIDSYEGLIAHASSCIGIMWPISVQKMSLENLADLFALLLRKADEGDLAPGIIDVGFLVISSYRASLGNSVNKKKFYQLFLQTSFFGWLRVLSRGPSPSTNSSSTHDRFLQNVYEAGTATLLNLDILRHLSGSRSADQSTALFEHLHTAFSSGPEAPFVLSVIPRLFLTYVQALKRHRGAVFNQSSNVRVATLTDEVNAASMKFFANFEAVLTGWGNGVAVNEGDIWKARLGLLETVLDENLFGVQQADAVVVLNKITQNAINVLSKSWERGYNDTISPAVGCLHKIGQIDCDLLLPSLPRILPSLLPISATDPAPMSFLDLILDYHTKTRTLNAHLTNLLSSFMPTSFPPSESLDRREVYELCFSGHILSSWHLAKLGSMIKSFLTPGRTPNVVENLVKLLRLSWQTFLDATEAKLSDGGSPKKRKKEKNAENEGVTLEVSGMPESTGYDVESLAVSFSLQAHLALVVLSNLPIQNLTGDSANAVRGVITKLRGSLVRNAVKKLLKTERLLPGNGKKKRGRGSAGSDGWATQVVTAAMLRVNYMLCVARGLGLDDEPDTSTVVERAKGIIVKEGGKGNLMAELELEIFRTLLFRMSTHHAHQDEALEILDNVLSYLTQSLRSSDCGWSGLPCHLRSSGSGALALFHLILERWLPFVDNLASPSQLTHIVWLILNIDLSRKPATTDAESRPEHLLLRVLHSAEFWEMHNIQSAFLSHLVEITDHPNSPLGETELAAYHLLLYVPAEYHNRPARALFIKRAFAADIQLVQGFLKGGDRQREAQQQSLLQKLVTLRAFLKRVIGLVGFERTSDVDLGDFVIHLMSFDCPSNGREYKVFAETTLDLTGLCFSELVKDSASHSGALLKIINSFSLYSTLVGVQHETRKLQSKLVTSLLDAITKLKSSSLSSQCVAALGSLHADLSKILSEQLQDMPQLSIIHYLETLVGWCCVLKLRRWLSESISGEGGDFFGKQLVPLIIQKHGDEERLDDVRDSIFAILRAELALVSDPVIRQKQLDLVFATFALFYDASRTTTRTKLDTHVSSVSQSLTPADYLHALNLLSEWLSSNQVAVGARETAVHLSILLLWDHPQNTLKHIQAFTTRCLGIFVSCGAFTHSTIQLRLLTLEFMVQHCSERPAALRPADLGGIWIVLFRLLEPSEEHDEVTTVEIFHKIVATLSALIRLRRDLLPPVLPHLSLILRQLLSLIRSCRPQLGTKQTSMVMRTLPRWVNVKRPLGGKEGRMLSRLLETLNIKTVVRSHTAGNTQKAESLAKPFSKHAASVLAAYIEALNDPLCVVSLEMRRELEPGLFTLCGLMGEHARDALVVGLDVNGKALLKMIWKEYEKQRYAGQG